MTTEEKINNLISIALKEVGTKENPPDSNNVKYNTWFYGKEVSGSNYSWCGVFVSWAFFNSQISLGTIDFLRGFASCPYAVKHIDKFGRIVTVPQKGDIVFYDWNGDGIFDHTGIFIEDLGKGYFRAVEGNTAKGNDSNGGEVMDRQDRKYKFAIFVRPHVLEPQMHSI